MEEWGGIKLVGHAMIVISIIILIGTVALTITSSYNSLVEKDQNVILMRGNIQTSLEQRADLIPNLVRTINGSSSFEKGTLIEIVQERSKIEKTTSTKELENSRNNIDATISRLQFIAEAYPTLKTTDSYKSMQEQLANTENQIRNDRNNYNAAVRDYQLTVRQFPTNIFASLFGFNYDRYDTFKSTVDTSVPTTQW